MKGIRKTCSRKKIVGYRADGHLSSGLTGNALAAWDRRNSIQKECGDLCPGSGKGGYKIISTAELKDWIDQKKDALIVDTNPEASYKKQHVPTAVHLELQRPEMTQLDDKTKEALLKILGRTRIV